MAREHVRQVLEEPQRRELLHALLAPVRDIERAVRAARGRERRGEFVELGGDEPGADVAAEAVGRDGRRVVGIGAARGEPGILHGRERRADRDLDVARHDLGRLAVALRDEFLDIEAVGELATRRGLEAGGIEGADGGKSGTTLAERLPEQIDADSVGGDGSEPGDDDAAAGHGRVMIPSGARHVPCSARH